MNIAGKREPSKLNELKNEGFDNCELYLTKSMIDNLNIVDLCKESNLNITSVHTPHINIKKSKNILYYKKTDIIADKLDATLVLHSNPTSMLLLTRIYPPENIISKSYGYENLPDVSSYFMENYILKQNYPLVLDTAHLHMAEKNYFDFFKSILKQYNSNIIPVIHLADGTRTNDGIEFGTGEIDLNKFLDIIQEYNYKGSVVLEFPVKNQESALNTVENYI